MMCLRIAALTVCAVFLVSACAISKENAATAVKTGDVRTVARYLKQKESNIADTLTLKNTYAHLAAENGQAEVLKLLIANGIDVNKTNGNGFTPLHLAAIRNKAEAAKLLLDAGADPNQPNLLDKKMAAIHYAAVNESLDVAQLLLDHGVSIDAPGAYKATPVIWAAYSGTLKSVKFFVDRGAIMTVVDTNGDTALTSAKESKKEDIVEYLLSIGVTK